ncbi:hypothetical protein ACL6C3_30105 [Capilliphycus salinus ALCB114379]|uniref:hypothetical protein n=1 Tax=Capilliphycus salinus TaxID=2768948 RepID=UPI0039A5B151
MDNFPFQSGQIVKLTHERYFLYAEVIQVVSARQVCWVRPLMLLEFSGDPHSPQPPSWENSPQTLYNLRESSDLIWPLKLFQPALDTEVIPLLVRLDSPDGKTSHAATTAHQQLRAFIGQVWQAYPDVFSK